MPRLHLIKKQGWPAPTRIGEDDFIASPKMADWLHQTFIRESAPLFNPDHTHLSEASIGVLWTTAENTKQGKLVQGTAEIPHPPQGISKWGKAKWEHQMRGWFGEVLPDFLLTFYWPFVQRADTPSVLALFEHELYHCAQAVDESGEPRYRKSDGRPVWTMVGHDVEEHIGVVRRYGHAAANVTELVEAAMRKPEIGRAKIIVACGYCKMKAA
ncbi:MAG: putative metallopeptidase [Blastocatellia bacterium]